MLVLSSAEAWALVEELALSKVQGRTPVQLAQGSLIPFSPVLPRPARALLVGYPEAQLSRFHWFRYPSSRPRTIEGGLRLLVRQRHSPPRVVQPPQSDVRQGFGSPPLGPHELRRYFPHLACKSPYLPSGDSLDLCGMCLVVPRLVLSKWPILGPRPPPVAMRTYPCANGVGFGYARRPFLSLP